jgi:hypothetical protein
MSDPEPVSPPPDARSQALAFLSGAVTEHLHTTRRLTRARDEADRLRGALTVAEQTVREAERDRDGISALVKDALDLVRGL